MLTIIFWNWFDISSSRSKLQRTLAKDMNLLVCQIQLTQNLIPTDHVELTFTEWSLTQEPVDNTNCWKTKIIIFRSCLLRQQSELWHLLRIQYTDSLTFHASTANHYLTHVLAWRSAWVICFEKVVSNADIKYNRC